MPIQWFPGHMAAARKKAGETLAAADVVIEVVDARIPEASTNPMIHQLRRHRQRPCLKILNKADLADPEATKAWLAHYAAQPDVRAVALSCKQQSDVAKVRGLAAKLAPYRTGPGKPLRLIIMGIPNVGKSTLMNALLKRRVAKVGDEPAVTKTQQRLDLDENTVLIDTPGMMWPKIAHDSDGYMLAASHAIGRNAVIDEEVAAQLGAMLLVRYAGRVAERYKLTPDAVATLDGEGLVEAVARRRGFLVKGGGIDLEKAALTLLQDYRDGALGRISLETPASREEMLQLAAQRATELAAAIAREASAKEPPASAT
ncbi:MAG: ribosome biogenesis GTPase YlqF [Betaproteobacteria bacterium]|nr:ribosome biogenesis GTPase YlqF [Betaproteobacteria bacterium]